MLKSGHLLVFKIIQRAVHGHFKRKWLNVYLVSDFGIHYYCMMGNASALAPGINNKISWHARHKYIPASE